MRGQILGVDAKRGEGLITGDDGRRYSFRPDDWAGQGGPAVGLLVDFQVDQDRATSIFAVPGTAMPGSAATITNDRNKYIAALLAFFIGTLGIHRFYLGRTGSGIVMLVLSCTLIGLVATVPWAFIDMIRYLVMSDRDFARRYAREPA